MDTDTHRCGTSRSGLYNTILAVVVLILAMAFTLILVPHAWVTGCSLAVLAALLGIRVILMRSASLLAKVIAGVVAALALTLAGSLLIDHYA